MKNIFLIGIMLLSALRLTAQEVQLVIESKYNSEDQKEFVGAYFMETTPINDDSIKSIKLYECNTYFDKKVLVEEFLLLKSNQALKLQHKDYEILIDKQWQLVQSSYEQNDLEGMLDFFFTKKEQKCLFLSEEEHEDKGIYYNESTKELVGWLVRNKEYTVVDAFPMKDFLAAQSRNLKQSGLSYFTKNDSVICAVIQDFNGLPIPPNVYFIGTTWTSRLGKDYLNIYRLRHPYSKGDINKETIIIDTHQRADNIVNASIKFNSKDSNYLMLRWQVPFYLTGANDTFYQTIIWEYSNNGWRKSSTLGAYPLPMNLGFENIVVPIYVYDKQGNTLQILQHPDLKISNSNNTLYRLYRKDGILFADVLCLEFRNFHISIQDKYGKQLLDKQVNVDKTGFSTIELGEFSKAIKNVDVVCHSIANKKEQKQAFQWSYSNVKID